MDLNSSFQIAFELTLCVINNCDYLVDECICLASLFICKSHLRIDDDINAISSPSPSPSPPDSYSSEDAAP